MTIPAQPDLKKPDVVARSLWDQCLGKGRQVVLRPDRWSCMERTDGEKLLNELDAKKFDPATACLQDDKRRMPTGILHEIKKLVDVSLNEPGEHASAIQKAGIRIIGGAYCQDEVNLSGFDLPVALNLDRSVFKFGFRARDMTIAGNLSFGGTYVYDNFDISDSNIGGALIGRGSFMQRIRLTNTEVRELLRFSNSILLEYFVLSNVTVGRTIDLSASRLTSFSMRSTPVPERLLLDNSESNCKYEIDKSEINELLAVNTGFGKATDSAKPRERTWRRPIPQPDSDTLPDSLLRVPAVKMFYERKTTCADTSARFGVVGGSIRSVCLRNFQWGEPTADNKAGRTILSFNSVASIGTMNVNLWRAAPSDKDAARAEDRILELVGTKIGTLAFDFGDNAHRYVTSVDQITIDRVHAADGGCSGYSEIIHWPTPDSKHVTEWLKKNVSPSLQPYAAFNKAFENAGVDTTDLKVAKASAELTRSFEKYQDEFSHAWNAAAKDGRVMHFLWQDGWHALIDLPAFGTKWILGFIADFGFRPAQVIWTVFVIVISSWLIFWLALRIVAFEMEKKKGMRSIGFSFLFDRLLPLYKLREDHYDVGAFYQRGKGPESKTIKYFGRSIECVPASPRRVRCAEIYLDFLKLLGIILAAFLVAAINALIAR